MYLPLVFLATCGGEIIEGRFDRTVFFPNTIPPRAVETEIDIHFGPGPNEAPPTERDVSPEEKPPSAPPEEPETSPGWWKR